MAHFARARSRLASSALLAAAAVTAATPAALSAQADPLAAKPADAAKPAGNPLDALAPPAAAAAAKLFVPDFVKPGARLLYEAGSSTEDRGPGKPGSAGVGITRFDVVGLADDTVLIAGDTFLGAPGGNGPFKFAGGSSTVTDARQVDAGLALWVSPPGLAALRASAGPGVTVLTGPWPLNGATYDSVSVTRVLPDSAARTVFETTRGLLLMNQTASGPPRRSGPVTDFNRENTALMSFRTVRQVDWPWAKAAPPDWARQVKTMRYEGQRVMSVPNGQPLAFPFASALTVTGRGDGWVTGTVKEESTAGPPVNQPFAGGPGLLGHYWINPAALAAMKEGEVDRDPTLRCAVTYQVQDGPQGRLGVLAEAGEGGSYQRVWGYDLRDGALAYGSFAQPDLHMKAEFRLVGRE